jgi:Zn-dependent oligopeptidase
MLRDWRVLQRPEEAAVLDEWIQALERRRSSPAELHEIHFSARFEHMFGASYICTYI